MDDEVDEVDETELLEGDPLSVEGAFHRALESIGSPCRPSAVGTFLQESGSARARVHDGLVEVLGGSSGGGVYGGGDLYFTALTEACAPLVSVESGWMDGSVVSRAEVSPPSGTRALQRMELLPSHDWRSTGAGLLATILRETAPVEQRVRDAGDAQLIGTLLREGPWLDGDPQPSEPWFLASTRGLDEDARLRLSAALMDDQDEAEGSLPTHVLTVGVSNHAERSFGATTMHTWTLPLRNGGVLVALSSPLGHRYVLETTRFLGSEIDWLGERNGYLVGMTRSSHPGGDYPGHGAILVLELSSGRAFSLEVPGMFESGEDVLSEQLMALDEEAMEACRDSTIARYAEERGVTAADLEAFLWDCPGAPEAQLIEGRVRSCEGPPPRARLDAGTLFLRTLDSAEREVDIDPLLALAAQPDAGFPYRDAAMR